MAYQQPPPQQNAVVEHGREPCPDRIIDDIGGAFAMGALGGGFWHTYRGLKNSPKGYKIQGTLETIRRESPRIGGNFANWGLMFSVFDCTMLYIRKKEDPFNAIAAGALTGGFLQLRAGLRPAFRSAVFGGVLLAIIEGLGITLQKMSSPPPPSMPPPMAMQPPPAVPGAVPGPEGFPGAAAPLPPPPAADAGSSSGSGSSGGGFWSWFGGGGGDQQPQESDSSKPHTFTEEAFAPPPMPKEFQSDSFK
eukprot:jgi/Chrzof1/7474/Cz02g25090.t1